MVATSSWCKREVRLARSARGIVVDEGFDPYPYLLSGSGGSHQRMSWTRPPLEDEGEHKIIHQSSPQANTKTSLNAEKYTQRPFLNLFKWNQIWIIITLFQINRIQQSNFGWFNMNQKSIFLCDSVSKLHVKMINIHCDMLSLNFCTFFLKTDISVCYTIGFGTVWCLIKRKSGIKVSMCTIDFGMGALHPDVCFWCNT